MRPLGERFGSGSNICGSRGCSWRRGGRWGGRRSPAIPVTAPTGDGAVAPHPAGVLPPSADGDEGTRGRRGPAAPVTAPTGDGAVAPHPAVVVRPGADGDEGTRGRRDLACGITAPAGDGAIAPHLAGVVPPGAHGDEGTAGGAASPSPFQPQQATEPSLLTPQVWSHPALTETKEPAGGVGGSVGAGVAIGTVASPSLMENAEALLYFRPLLQRNSPLRSQLATLNRCLEPRIHVSRSP